MKQNDAYSEMMTNINLTSHHGQSGRRTGTLKKKMEFYRTPHDEEEGTRCQATVLEDVNFGDRMKPITNRPLRQGYGGGEYPTTGGGLLQFARYEKTHRQRAPTD